jgi:hypothetical protein
MQNASIESFNGRLRDELLNETLFTSMAQAASRLDAGGPTTTTTLPGILVCFRAKQFYFKVARNAPDYSFGLYIYAFPVQQGLITSIPSASAAEIVVLLSR